MADRDELEAKKQNIHMMMATQAQGTNIISQIAANSVGGSKEAVLRKLLETQDSYIHELEAKCKAMTAQLMSDQGQLNLSLEGEIFSASSQGLQFHSIDLEQLETSEEPAGDKIDKVI